MAERMGIARQTLIKLEAGDPSVGLSVLLRALDVLGLSGDIDGLAADDQIGRRLEDLRLSRAPRRRGPSRSVR
jgi:transcriptional regulator with XRE-family HTH domain